MPTSPAEMFELEKLFSSYPNVIAVWLFGSARTGWTRPDSDIDVGVYYVAPPTLDDWLALHADLQETFDFEEIDLIVLNGKPPILRFEAVSGQMLYCRNRSEMAAFVSLTARQYEDSMALLARGFAVRKAALARAEA